MEISLLTDEQRAFFAKPQSERREIYKDQLQRSKLVSSGALPKLPPFLRGEFNLRELPSGKVFQNPLNLSIGKKYEYHTSEGQSGEFTIAYDLPSFVNLPGVKIVSDMGGRLTLDGKRIKSGLLYRSSHLSETKRIEYFSRDEIILLDKTGTIKKRITDLETTINEYSDFPQKQNAHATLSKEWAYFAPTRLNPFSPIVDGLISSLHEIPTTFLAAKREKIELNEEMRYDFPFSRDNIPEMPIVLMQEVTVAQEGYATFSFGADWFWSLRINGELVADFSEAGNPYYPPEVNNVPFACHLKAGKNLFVVILKSGSHGFTFCAKCNETMPLELACQKRAALAKRNLEYLLAIPKRIPENADLLPPETIREATEHLGIKVDLDLRSDMECQSMHRSPLGDAVKWIQISSGCYWQMNEDWAKEALVNALRIISNPDNLPLIFHCHAGRDRTGTLAFILQGLLLVPEEELFKDWEAPIFAHQDAWACYENCIDRFLPILNTYEGSTLHDRIRSYVLSAGFTTEEIDTLRTQLLA